MLYNFSYIILNQITYYRIQEVIFLYVDSELYVSNEDNIRYVDKKWCYLSRKTILYGVLMLNSKDIVWGSWMLYEIGMPYGEGVSFKMSKLNIRWIRIVGKNVEVT